jgi:serine/threonine-protein kinase
MATCPTCRKRYPDNVATCQDDGETLLPNEAFSGVDVDLSTGQKVGEYEIVAKIGVGGFGSVYKAVHPLIGKSAAIKVLSRQYSANPQMVSRFIREAKVVNQIRHRNIIDVFSFGTLEDGRQYFVMELLDGQPLDQYLHARGGRLKVEEAVPILRAIARALDAAHAAGIWHRDLKPENVFLSFDEDGHAFPKLLDFGIAKLTDDSSTGVKTRTGTPMGTPYYMSPEQCRGKNVDHRTDIYSFGIMTHAMLSGQLPFDGDDMMDLLIKQSTMPPPTLSSVAPDLPAVLDPPILAMLEKDPAKRPRTLGEAVDALVQAARAAGFAVTLSGDGRRVDQLSGAPTLPMTPEQAASMGSAKTLTPRTLPSGVGEAPPRKSRAGLLIGVTLGVVAIGALAAFAVRGAERAATADRPNVTVTVSSTGTAVTVTNPTAGATPNPSTRPETASASTSASPEVLVTIKSTPEHAVIYLGDERLGVAPGPIKLKRGSETVMLTLKADGFTPGNVEVQPSENNMVSIALTKATPAHRAAPGRKSPQEIENPF